MKSLKLIFYIQISVINRANKELLKLNNDFSNFKYKSNPTKEPLNPKS